MSAKAYKIDNPMAVIGELAKKMQEKYGDEALSVFSQVLQEYGFHAGIRLKNKMEQKGLADRVEAWLAPIIAAGLCEVVEKGTGRVTVKGWNCPLNLEGSNQGLCDACMSIDIGLVSALAEQEIKLTVIKSMARGDAYCMVSFER